MTYWLIIWMLVCPITGERMYKETKTYNKPSWSDVEYIELPYRLTGIGRPIKITKFWDEYTTDKDTFNSTVIHHMEDEPNIT